VAKTGPKPKPWTERFKINPSTGCHEWSGGRNDHGYGLVRIDGKQRYAHRVAYAREYGPLQPGMIVCHHCDNTCCVNLAHLFLGTPADNTADMLKKGRGGFRPSRGESHGRARLSDADVIEIRRLYGIGDVRQVDLARRFGVSQPQVSEIIRGEAWAHVPPP
jgi:hypothetical protein